MPALFQPDLFKFLRQLKKNNDRDWFNDNKQRFEDSVREPVLEFVRQFEPHLHAISPHFVASDKKVGGSMFRIYRDVRFSANKDPYKTHIGVHFRHENAESAHSPGFYLHLEPEKVFAGVGIWMPESKVAHQIRAAIDRDQDRWQEITDAKSFTKNWDIVRDQALKRPPQGFKKDHPLLDDLKLKQFVAFSDFTEEDTQKPNFVKQFAKRNESAAAFMEFVTEAVGEAW
jgi:uncharacterized protein (TIGR02453 family)